MFQYSLTVFNFTECINSAQCSTLKHHYDECGERVREQEADPDYKGFKEDCVEECRFGSFLDVLLYDIFVVTQPQELRNILSKFHKSRAHMD